MHCSSKDPLAAAEVLSKHQPIIYQASVNLLKFQKKINNNNMIIRKDGTNPSQIAVRECFRLQWLFQMSIQFLKKVHSKDKYLYERRVQINNKKTNIQVERVFNL